MRNRNIESSILIVDDNPQITQFLKCILLEENFHVTIAKSGEEALNHNLLSSMDLIILDVNMPGLCGFEVCKSLKEANESKDIPVIFLSAINETEEKVKGLECGAIDYITKPFNIIELLARIKVHIRTKHYLDKLKEMALMDCLTELYNYGFIHDRLSEEINKTKRHQLDLSLIMIDLDNFKLINDTYGHKLGDTVLKTVANTIVKNIRAEDIAARYGGEEFLIILPNTTLKPAHLVAEKIRSAIKEIEWDIKDFQITLSGGVHSLKNETVNEFIETTDKLLYKAKQTGKDQIISSIAVLN